MQDYADGAPHEPSQEQAEDDRGNHSYLKGL